MNGADTEQAENVVLRFAAAYGCEAHLAGSYEALILTVVAGIIAFKASLEAPSGKAIKVMTARVITWVLKALVDAPVQVRDEVLVLRYFAERGHRGTFVVRAGR